MGFVGYSRMITRSHVSMQTYDYCFQVVCDANVLVRINKTLNLQFFVTITTSFIAQGHF